jgi:hypothetical protein
VNSFDIQTEVFVLKFETENQEWNSKVAEFHKLAETKIKETCPKPKNELHKLQLRVNHLLKQKMERKSIGEAECKFRNSILEQIAINVESIMTVIIPNEWMNIGKLVHHND